VARNVATLNNYPAGALRVHFRNLPYFSKRNEVFDYFKAKVAGVAGAIVAMSDVANAFESAIKGDYAKAGGQAAGAAYGAMGPFAQLLSGAGSAGLSAEEEARQLRMRDYALKAGRGVDQGYDPRRLIGVAPPTR
jgi:hypothetical protein